MGQKPFEISKTHTEFGKLDVADFTPNIEGKNLSILIGLDCYFWFIKGNVIRSENDNLVALESKPRLDTQWYSRNRWTYFQYSHLPWSNKFLKPESSEFSDTESDCIETFKENLFLNGSRYEVKLPFRPHTVHPIIT